MSLAGVDGLGHFRGLTQYSWQEEMLLGGIHVIKLLMTFLLVICLFITGESHSKWCSSKEIACQCRRHKKLRFDSLVGKIPWSRKWLPTPVLLPGNFHGHRSLEGCSPWGHKESDTTERAQAHTRICRFFFNMGTDYLIKVSGCVCIVTGGLGTFKGSGV